MTTRPTTAEELYEVFLENLSARYEGAEREDGGIFRSRLRRGRVSRDRGRERGPARFWGDPSACPSFGQQNDVAMPTTNVRTGEEGRKSRKVSVSASRGRVCSGSHDDRSLGGGPRVRSKEVAGKPP